jgi:autophagy-related protein 9
MKIEELQTTHKISNVKNHDALDIASRLMRKDNFLIAIMNQNIFDIDIDLFPFSIFSGRYRAPFIGTFFEWCFRLVVLNPMFTDEFCISEDFMCNRERLRRDMIQKGKLGLLLSPFILLFRFIFFFLQHFESFYSNRSDLIAGERSRTWTPYAKLLLREYNELPDVFSARIDSTKAHSLALKFTKMFPNFLISIFGRFFSFISGSIVGVLLAITLLGKASVLTNLSVFGNSLLWYMVAFSSILAISRSFTETEAPSEDPESVMNDLSLITHYFPKKWKNKCHEPKVSQEFAYLYQSRIENFFKELLSVILTPIVFIYILPYKVDAILNFIESHKTSIEGIGDVCDFSRFTERTQAHSIHEERNDKKMEKSMLNFAIEHPHWKPDERNQTLLQSIKSDVQNRSLESDQSLRRMEDSGEALNQNSSYFFQHEPINLSKSSYKANMFSSLLRNQRSQSSQILNFESKLN